jgi:hypothetical protein
MNSDGQLRPSSEPWPPQGSDPFSALRGSSCHFLREDSPLAATAHVAACGQLAACPSATHHPKLPHHVRLSRRCALGSYPICASARSYLDVSLLKITVGEFANFYPQLANSLTTINYLPIRELRNSNRASSPTRQPIGCH